MQDTVPAADVRELAAAIRTALDPPKAALSVERARLLEERAGYVCGALVGLATDADPALWVRIAAEVIRETVADIPVRYEVQTMLSAPVPLASLREREHYEGEPDGIDVPVFEPDDDQQCGAKHGRGFICTRTTGHRFNHAAIFSSGDLVHTWLTAASHLAPPAPYGHQSLQPAKDGA